MKTTISKLGPRPSPDKISFERDCFKVVGIRKYWKVMGALAGHSWRTNERFDSLEEAQKRSKGNLVVSEHEEEIRERVKWF